MPERFHSNWLQIFVFCLINHFFLDMSIKKHKNINFSTETGIIVSLFFLDVKMSQESKTPVTSIFRGDTFNGLQTNLISFIPLEYKSSLVHTLINRFFDLLSNYCKHMKFVKLRVIFQTSNTLKMCSWNVTFKFCLYIFLRKLP